jgi:hypothetical protein
MALILAIEPNKNQAHQLNALVRAHLKAELVTAPTAAAALSALGDRVPDVVLTPALFGLRDEAALTDRLRQLGNDASHVQTLSIPILAPASTKTGPNGGILGRKKDKADANVGCDPAVFAEQIRIYLQRASVERRAQVSEASARAMVSTPASAPDAAPVAEDYSAFMVSADELDVDSLELSTLELPEAAAPPPAPVPEPASHEGQSRRSNPKVETRPAPSAVEEELGLVTPPVAGPPLWRVAESIEDFYGSSEGTAAAGSNVVAERPHAVAPPAAAAPAKVVTTKPAATAAPPAPRPRRTPPRPDEWAYFDPSQGAFKALVRRLDEIAGAA